MIRTGHRLLRTEQAPVYPQVRLLDAMRATWNDQVLLNSVYVGLADRYIAPHTLDRFANKVGRLAHENERQIKRLFRPHDKPEA
jgi:hypothetical protein